MAVATQCGWLCVWLAAATSCVCVAALGDVPPDTSGIAADTLRSELRAAISALVGFFTANPVARTPDALLGIRLGQLQLAGILTWERQWQGVAADTKWMRKLESDVTGLLLNSAANDNYVPTVMRELSNPLIWRDTAASCIPPRTVCPEPNGCPPLANTDETRRAYERLFDNIDMGLPTAADSDECLAELLRLPSGDWLGISSRCLDVVMAVDRKAYGYHLTHKLFYYMVMKNTGQMSMLPIQTAVETTIMLLCRQIWAETSLFSAVGFPKDMRDLFVEQILLCGSNGYREFLQTKWALMLIEWQQPATGCFDYTTYSIETDPLLWRVNSTRIKRFARPLPNNCSDHMSGLAFAAFIQYLKFTYVYYN